ncbi:hypothetical protein BV375_04605 [Nostoc sp. 106C]|nr:hypothetical protein [Nostoc sp. 106C]OUL34300.1 hypothetical protein BV375_04605 [Nostoc sp. 106C]
MAAQLQASFLELKTRVENRTTIVNLLEPLGFVLMEAVNGKQELNKALAWHPELIITDIQNLGTATTIGDIAGVKEETPRLHQLDIKYLAFTGKLLKLTQYLNKEAIPKLLKQYIL